MEKFKKIFTEAKVNKVMLLKKILEGYEFNMTIDGGNGFVKKKGKNLLIYESFYYDADERLAALKKDWGVGGTYTNYFKEEIDADIKIVGSGSDFHSKIFGKNLGACWVEIEVN